MPSRLMTTGSTSPTRTKVEWRPSRHPTMGGFESLDGQYRIRTGLLHGGCELLLNRGEAGYEELTSERFETPREGMAWLEEYLAKREGAPRCDNAWRDRRSGAVMRCHNVATAGRYHRPAQLGGDMNVCNQCIPVLLDRVIVAYRVGEAT